MRYQPRKFWKKNTSQNAGASANAGVGLKQGFVFCTFKGLLVTILRVLLKHRNFVGFVNWKMMVVLAKKLNGKLQFQNGTLTPKQETVFFKIICLFF